MRIQENLIYNNADGAGTVSGLGIDIVGGTEDAFGVTANDAPAALDGDGGPNALQNHPVLYEAGINGGNIRILGRLESAANLTYRIEFFASPAADASGYGEGQVVPRRGDGHHRCRGLRRRSTPTSPPL